MTAKDYLKQLWRIDHEIDAKQILLDNLRSKALIPQMPDNQDRVLGSGYPQDHISDYIAKIVDMEKLIDRKTKKLVKLKATILTQIEGITGKTESERQIYRIILTCRYVLYMKDWEEIGRLAGYSRSQVHHWHGKALQVFEAQYLKKKNRIETD